MKKWTVMMIPHDRGSSRTLNLSAYQLWIVVALMVCLSFTTSFFFKRHQTLVHEVTRLRENQKALEIEWAKKANGATPTTLTAQERIEIEQRLRSEYEASIAAITAEMGDLYDFESQARSLTGLAPRTPANEVSAVLGGGKGGGSSGLDEIAYEADDELLLPPRVVYGLSRPSADLIIQEVNLRTKSLEELVASLEAREEQLRRLPSIWPTASWQRKITSGFGLRKDPFTYRIRRHDGTDISASYGSPIVATAKGVVVFSKYEGGLGHLVKIDHGNGIETWYGHLQKRLVNVGDNVKRNDKIGTLGSSGRSTGPHVHYEVHVNGKPVNPAKYLGN